MDDLEAQLKAWVDAVTGDVEPVTADDAMTHDPAEDAGKVEAIGRGGSQRGRWLPAIGIAAAVAIAAAGLWMLRSPSKDQATTVGGAGRWSDVPVDASFFRHGWQRFAATDDHLVGFGLAEDAPTLFGQAVDLHTGDVTDVAMPTGPRVDVLAASPGADSIDFANTDCINGLPCVDQVRRWTAKGGLASPESDSDWLTAIGSTNGCVDAEPYWLSAMTGPAAGDPLAPAEAGSGEPTIAPQDDNLLTFCTAAGLFSIDPVDVTPRHIREERANDARVPVGAPIPTRIGDVRVVQGKRDALILGQPTGTGTGTWAPVTWINRYGESKPLPPVGAAGGTYLWAGTSSVLYWVGTVDGMPTVRRIDLGPPADRPTAPSTTGGDTTVPVLDRFTFTGTILESTSHGPQLCLGAMMMSLPPQCGGPDLVGFDWDQVDGEETTSGTTWGGATVVGTYDGTTFTLTEPARPPEQSSGPGPTPTFPNPCPTIAAGAGWPDESTRIAGRQAVQDYAAAQPDHASTYVTYEGEGVPSDGVLVVTFTGDLERHQREVDAIEAGPVCVAVGEPLVVSGRRALAAFTADVGDSQSFDGIELQSFSLDELSGTITVAVDWDPAGDLAARWSERYDQPFEVQPAITRVR